MAAEDSGMDQVWTGGDARPPSLFLPKWAAGLLCTQPGRLVRQEAGLGGSRQFLVQLASDGCQLLRAHVLLQPFEELAFFLADVPGKAGGELPQSGLIERASGGAREKVAQALVLV